MGNSQYNTLLTTKQIEARMRRVLARYGYRFHKNRCRDAELPYAVYRIGENEIAEYFVSLDKLIDFSEKLRGL